MALFKRKRQYQSVDQHINPDPTPSLTKKDVDSPKDVTYNYDVVEFSQRENKRTKLSHEELSNNIVFEDDLLDGYGPDLYGDENDRRFLESLPEFQRENILMQRHERRQEIQRKINRLKKEGRLRERKPEDIHDDLIPEYGQHEQRNSSLNDLRLRRLEQKERRKKAEEVIQTQLKKKQAEYQVHEESIQEQEIVYEEPQKEIRIPPLYDLLHITLSRNAIQAWMKQPYFQNVVKNCFIKYHTGKDEYSKIYKFGEIISVDDCNPYVFGNGTCAQCLRVRVGDDEELVFYSQLSNQPISQHDYGIWVQRSYSSRMPEHRFPSPEHIVEKATKLKEAQDESQSELLRLKLENRRYTIDDSFTTISKAISECRLELLQDELSDAEREKKRQLLQELTSIMEKKQQPFSSDKKVRINEKIQQESLAKVNVKPPKRKMEKVIPSGDPFSRIESQGSNMFITRTIKPEKVEEIVPSQIEKPKEVTEKKRSIDAKDIANAHDFDLGLDLDDLGAL